MTGALDAIDRATVGGRGGDRRSEAIKHNNIMNDPVEKSAQGTSNTYALRKLRKDRPACSRSYSPRRTRPITGQVKRHYSSII